MTRRIIRVFPVSPVIGAAGQGARHAGATVCTGRTVCTVCTGRGKGG